MRRTLSVLAVTGLLMAVVPAASAAGPSTDLRTGPMLGIVHAKHTAGLTGGSGNMTYHNGAVMTTGAAVTPIFWGPKWSNTSYRGDVVPGIQGLYAAFSDTGYMGTNTEYTQAGGANVSKVVSVSNALFDAGLTPTRKAPSTSDVLTVVQRNITNPVANGYYPVYTDVKRGSARYCAWHSWGTVKGVLVQFAFFFDLTGDSGCDPQDPGTARSQNLEALASVTGHELSEAVTDPHGDGWYDGSGAENADKCAWKFDQPVDLGTYGTWKIQGNWSNAAYTAGTGFANASGQKGCLYN